MGLLSFFKTREQRIDFSDENVEKLSKSTDELGDTLIKAGFGSMVDHLTQIRLAAARHDTTAFKKLVISPELFEGSGAMWEIWINDKQLQADFNEQFCAFIDLLKSMGIKNGRINQVRKGIKLSDKTN
jgi:hypothetical protein